MYAVGICSWRRHKDSLGEFREFGRGHGQVLFCRNAGVCRVFAWTSNYSQVNKREGVEGARGLTLTFNRDLKPGNFVIDKAGHLKLIDVCKVYVQIICN
jgi:hypothetical protein